jgi:succinate dehydrogenase / fumarate reductase iron-sulfur subunit
MKLTLNIWRQQDASSKGQFVTYPIDDISPDMSFLEMLDVLNNKLILQGQEPVEFDHDCREGICGSCSLQINGEPHGPDRLVTTCQLHMRMFKDGDTIDIEPFRAKAFPVIKDLIVDRSAFDRIQQAGGYVSVNTSGNTTDANAILVQNTTQTMRLALLPVSVVGLVSLRVKTPQPCSLPQPRSLNTPCCHKVRSKRLHAF